MPKDVQLKDVTAANWRAVVRLKLEESQKELWRAISIRSPN